MEQIKSWESITTNQYIFAIDHKETGRMTIAAGTPKRKAAIVIGEKKYQLLRAGFWKSTVDIVNEHGTPIGKIYPKKWYANAMTIDLYQQTYQLVFRNNPLAEFAITKNGQDVLAYGLNTGLGTTSLKIVSGAAAANYLLDFILWYWFLPVAMENIVSADGVYESVVVQH